MKSWLACCLLAYLNLFFDEVFLGFWVWPFSSLMRWRGGTSSRIRVSILAASPFAFVGSDFGFFEKACMQDALWRGFIGIRHAASGIRSLGLRVDFADIQAEEGELLLDDATMRSSATSWSSPLATAACPAFRPESVDRSELVGSRMESASGFRWNWITWEIIGIPAAPILAHHASSISYRVLLFCFECMICWLN